MQPGNQIWGNVLWMQLSFLNITIFTTWNISAPKASADLKLYTLHSVRDLKCGMRVFGNAYKIIAIFGQVCICQRCVIWSHELLTNPRTSLASHLLGGGLALSRGACLVDGIDCGLFDFFEAACISTFLCFPRSLAADFRRTLEV